MAVRECNQVMAGRLFHAAAFGMYWLTVSFLGAASTLSCDLVPALDVGGFGLGPPGRA